MIRAAALLLACLAGPAAGDPAVAGDADAPEILVSFTADPGTSLSNSYRPADRPGFETDVARTTAERLNRSYPFLRWVTTGDRATYRMDVRLRLASGRAAVAVERFTISVTPLRPVHDGCARYTLQAPEPVEFEYIPPARVQDRASAVAEMIVTHVSARAQQQFLAPIRVPYAYRMSPGHPNGVIETTLDALKTDAGHLAFRVDYWAGDGRESCVDTRIQLSPRGRAENAYIVAVFDSVYYGATHYPAAPEYLRRLQQYRGLSVVKYVRVDVPSRVTSNGTVWSTQYP